MDTSHVTKEMREAGSNIASALCDASIAKSFDGLGGSKTWDEWLGEEEIPNRDIVLAYLEEEINSVTAIYITMEREKSK